MTSQLILAGLFLATFSMAMWCLTKVPLRQLRAGDAFALASPFLFPFVAVAWSFLFWWHGPENTEPAWHDMATGCLLLLYPGLCVFSIWRSRGFRWFAAGLIPLSLLISFFATLWTVAVVTGD
jgi:hypothetical protein